MLYFIITHYQRDRFETQVPGVQVSVSGYQVHRFQVSGALVSGARYQVSGANVKIAEI